MDVVVFAALIWQIVDWARELSNLPGSRSSVVTQAVAWIVGIGLAFIGAHAQIAQGLVLPGTDAALGTLDWGSLVLVGLLVSSTASTGVDVKQAFDRSDSAVKPPLLPASTSPAVENVVLPPEPMAVAPEAAAATESTTTGGPTAASRSDKSAEGGKGRNK